MSWAGKRIRTRVADRNEVEGRGLVDIPVGWCGRVSYITHYEDGEAMYAVMWDDNSAAPGGAGNMGWTIWSGSELRDRAEELPS